MVNKLLTTKKASEFLGVSTSTIYRMEEKGILNPSKTPGGQRRFDINELLLYREKSINIKAPQNPSEANQIEVTNIINNDLKDNSNSEKLSIEEKEEKRGKYDPRNKLNDLTGTEWMPETKSFTYQKGLGAKHPHAKIERLHPAPFSFQDVGKLISFFTKEGMIVLDPFGGVGSTAKACAIENRNCISIELSQKWHDLAIQRLEKEVGPNASNNHTFINGDSSKVVKTLDDNSIDFVVTSPPYWSILNKKADHKVKNERLKYDLDTNYSDDDERDIGNIEEYNDFLNILVNDFLKPVGHKLKPKKYMCVIVSDFRNKSEYISFHSDLIQNLNNKSLNDKYKFHLQGCKVLIQNHKSLLPYGYPFAYVENIHHQYILIFRKDN